MRQNMIKWRPFYSIPNQNEIIENLRNNRLLVQRPILSEDQLNELDENFKKANEQIEIKHYSKGMIIYTKGKITKINYIEKYILINNIKIYFKNIIRIY